MARVFPCVSIKIGDILRVRNNEGCYYLHANELVCVLDIIPISSRRYKLDSELTDSDVKIKVASALKVSGTHYKTYRFSALKPDEEVSRSAEIDRLTSRYAEFIDAANKRELPKKGTQAMHYKKTNPCYAVEVEKILNGDKVEFYIKSEPTRFESFEAAEHYIKDQIYKGLKEDKDRVFTIFGQIGTLAAEKPPVVFSSAD